MRALIVTVALLILACGNSITEPSRVGIEYTIELINGTMSHVYFVEPGGELITVPFVAGDSLYHYEFVFDVGDTAGLGAYPGKHSVVTVILTQDGENVVTEYALDNEPTMWYWEVGE